MSFYHLALSLLHNFPYVAGASLGATREYRKRCFERPAACRLGNSYRRCKMAKLARALLIVTALAMLVSWTVWASAQVAAGETVAIKEAVFETIRLQDTEGWP